MTAEPERRPASLAVARPDLSGARRGAAAQRTAEDDLPTLFGHSRAVFALMSGPSHVLESANATFFAAIGGGERGRTGVPLGDLMPELAGRGFLFLLDRVHRTGERHVGRNARVVLGEGTAAREAYFDFTCEPRPDAGGDIVGVRVIGVETTQVKHARRPAAEHRFVTLIHGRLTPTPQGLAVDLVRAGHTLPLLLDDRHTGRSVDAPSALLGVGVDPQVSPCRLLLRPHESLLLYTDGITECRTATGPEQYGDARLARALASAPRRPGAQDVLRAVAGDVHSFTGGGDVDDDQAALVITAR